MIAMRVVPESEHTLKIDVSMDGGTDELIDEIAAGVGAIIIEMGEDYKGRDPIHELLLKAVCDQTTHVVRERMRRREEAADKPEDA